MPRVPKTSTEKRVPKHARAALKLRTPEDIANEQTAVQLALRLWVAMVGATVLSGMSALADELLTSSLFDDDDDDEEGDDEGWFDDHHEREKKLLDEAIADGLDKFPDINAINNLPPSSDPADPEIVQAADHLRKVLAKCAIGATELKKTFSRAQLERRVKSDLAKRLKENPKYSEHVRGDVPGSNIKKHGNRGCTSSKGTFAKAADYVGGGGLMALFIGGWIRVAKDRIDPWAWSHQFGFERKTERQNWVQHYVITERSGKQSRFELPRKLLSGTGALAIRELRKAGVLLVRRDVVQKALVRFLDFHPKLEIIRMSQVGFFEVDGHYICVRSNETLLPPALRELKNVAYAADNAHDPDQYGHQIKGTTADWQKKVAGPLRGNSNVALAFATAFSSALIPFADEQRGGAHLWGKSGIGKSVAISAGESIYGLPSASQNRHSYGRSWAVTSMGLEDLLPFRNHAGLFLDELQRVPPELRGIDRAAHLRFHASAEGAWRLVAASGR